MIEVCEALFILQKEDIVCGSRVKVAIDRHRDFVEKLKAAGATKIVYFKNDVDEGPCIRKYRKEWCEFYQKQYTEQLVVSKKVKLGISVHDIVKSIGAGPFYSVRILKFMDLYFANTGDLVLDSKLRAVEYAIQHKAMAIIAHDTDFLVYPGDWQLWSLPNIEYPRLITYELNRDALLIELELTRAQMPLFATLCGNKIVRPDTLKDFHRLFEQKNMQREKFTGISSFTYRETVRTDRDKIRIVQRMLNKTSSFDIRRGLDYLKQSLASYDYNTVSES